MEHTVDIPVPGLVGGVLVFKVFFLDRVQQRCFPLENVFLSGLCIRPLIFPVEAFKSFAQDRVHPLLRTFQRVFVKVWMSLVNGVFRTFLQNKKSAKSGSHSSQRVPACFSPSTPAPQQRVRLMQWVMILDEHGLHFWNMDTGEKRWQVEEGSNPRWWWRDGKYTDFGEWLWVLVRGGADCAWVLLVSYGGFWKNCLFFVAAVALFALENLSGLCLCPRFFLPWSGVWVLPVEYVVFSGRVRCLVQQWIHHLREF